MDDQIKLQIVQKNSRAKTACSPAPISHASHQPDAARQNPAEEKNQKY